MPETGRTYSVIQLNEKENGFGVVDNTSVALARVEGLAIRLTENAAAEVAASLNAEADERRSAGVQMPSSSTDLK